MCKAIPEVANSWHGPILNSTQWHQRLTLAGMLLQRAAPHLLLTRTRQMTPLRVHPGKTAGCSWMGFSPPLTVRGRRTWMAVPVHQILTMMMMMIVRAQVMRKQFA